MTSVAAGHRRVPGWLDGPHQMERPGGLEDFLADILRHRSANTAATPYKVLRVLDRWLEEDRNVPSR
jgi:hypothetical protein